MMERDDLRECQPACQPFFHEEKDEEEEEEEEEVYFISHAHTFPPSKVF